MSPKYNIGDKLIVRKELRGALQYDPIIITEIETAAAMYRVSWIRDKRVISQYVDFNKIELEFELRKPINFNKIWRVLNDHY